jgi:uncharacterized membrane protein
MDHLISVVGTMALLGSAVVGGIFFAFSSFVMKALARVPSAEGIGAMQSINVVVLNPSFLGAFIGTAVVSLGAGGLALAGWGRPSAPFFLGGALFYLVGTFLVTGLGNVPLNEEPRPDGRRDGRRTAVHLGSYAERGHVMTILASEADGALGGAELSHRS